MLQHFCRKCKAIIDGNDDDDNANDDRYDYDYDENDGDDNNEETNRAVDNWSAHHLPLLAWRTRHCPCLLIIEYDNCNDYYCDNCCNDNFCNNNYCDRNDNHDLYIIGAVCMSRFCLFHFLPFLDTFGSKNMRKSV